MISVKALPARKARRVSIDGVSRSRGAHDRVEMRCTEVDLLKLTTGKTSLCTESAGANRAGSRKAPQLTFLVHEHCSARKLHAVGPFSGESRTRPPEYGGACRGQENFSRGETG